MPDHALGPDVRAVGRRRPRHGELLPRMRGALDDHDLDCTGDYRDDVFHDEQQRALVEQHDHVHRPHLDHHLGFHDLVHEHLGVDDLVDEHLGSDDVVHEHLGADHLEHEHLGEYQQLHDEQLELLRADHDVCFHEYL